MQLTNQSGGDVVEGDVVVIDGANDDAFVTTTTAAETRVVGVVRESIAAGDVGRVTVAGYVSTINVPGSATRGHYGFTSTTAKAADDASARDAGAFCQFLTGGTTPEAVLFGAPDNGGATSAGAVSYDPSTSGLSATDVQDAIDEIVAEVAGGANPTVHYVADAGAALTIDLSVSRVWDITLTQDCTISASGFPAAGIWGEIAVIVHQDSTGGWVLSYDSAIEAPSTGTTLPTTADSTSGFGLGSEDGGTTVYWIPPPGGGGGGSTTFGTPALTLGTANAAGSTDEAIRRDATILAFDATVPVTQAFGDSAATGSAAIAARRDHRHGMPADSSGPSATSMWRPLMDGAGAVVTDGATGEAVMAYQ